jgi:hypothetical protein
VVSSELTVSTNGVCLSWSSLVGTNYFVEAKRTITDTTWTNVSGTITATATNTTYCLPKSTPYHFFQVLSTAGSGTGTGAATNEVTLSTPVVLTGDRLELAWAAQIGATYEIQFTTNLLPVIHWTTLTNIVPRTSVGTFTDATRLTNGVIRFYRIVKP